ncbi:DUF397 domain-containing protein [Actinophytocola sp.]|uniref:DUF397 domain-containing protein n=1 Tax=Actinophytocola sp. TaxID=1872138 RepID=UPI003D6B022D
MRDTGWFKSTRSTSGSDNCVEVRISDAAARVRDSKNPGGGELMLDRTAFAAFVLGAAAGR